MSLEKPFSLKPLSIEAMQLTVVLLRLDGKFLCLVVDVTVGNLEVSMVQPLKVEVVLCTKAFLARMELSELPDNCTD